MCERITCDDCGASLGTTEAIREHDCPSFSLDPSVEQHMVDTRELSDEEIEARLQEWLGAAYTARERAAGRELRRRLGGEDR